MNNYLVLTFKFTTMIILAKFVLSYVPALIVAMA